MTSLSSIFPMDYLHITTRQAKLNHQVVISQDIKLEVRSYYYVGPSAKNVLPLILAIRQAQNSFASPSINYFHSQKLLPPQNSIVCLCLVYFGLLSTSLLLNPKLLRVDLFVMNIVFLRENILVPITQQQLSVCLMYK